MKPYIPSKELLEMLYPQNSVTKLARLFNVSNPRLCDWLAEYQLGNYQKREKKTKTGTRDDIGIYVRSSWEANVCRVFNLWITEGKITSWEYEPKTFIFYDIKKGTRSYTPDFLLNYPDGKEEFVEVKGRMDSVSKTKLKRMAKYYPEYTVKLIDSTLYKQIEKQYKGLIPNWE
jgi:hypothetical protein